MKNIYFITSFLMLVLFVSACDDEKKVSKSSAPAMKCGTGKCGANMFNGSVVLVKKKKNILSQMRENDPRKDCVKKAKTTKATYNCVRNPKTNRMTLKCGTAMK